MAKIGTHCIAEFFHCPANLLNDAKLIAASIREAAIRAKSELLHEVTHSFEPHGVTALALLAESHISIHTWPETGYAAVDAFTCGDHAIPEAACRHLAEVLQAGRVVMSRTPRGATAQHKLEPFGMDDNVLAAPTTKRVPKRLSPKEQDECQELRYAQISG